MVPGGPRPLPPSASGAAGGTALPPLGDLLRPAADAFAPYAHSLPSSFQRAKPRVYRSAFTADAARPRQTACAVVSASGADDDPPLGDGSDEPSGRADADAGADGGRRPRPLAPAKAAVVTLEELADGSTFLLDFRPGTRPQRAVRSSSSAAGRSSAADARAADRDLAPLVSWEGMTERQRRLELRAAAKSRVVCELARSEGVQVPTALELGPADEDRHDRPGDGGPHRPGLAAGAFARWFLASRQRRQRVREAFLREELSFAARDPLVRQQLAARGLPGPPEPPAGPAWRAFATWYALGRPSAVQTHAGEQRLLLERLEERADYLEHRLGIVSAAEAQLALLARDAASMGDESIGDDPVGDEPMGDADHHPPRVPTAVFVFEAVPIPRAAGADDDPRAWGRASAACRHKELALALLDPQVQVAALRSAIELPDLSAVASLEGAGVLALAGRFLPWWRAARNPHRRAFLQREAREASRDAAVLELLRQTADPQQRTPADASAPAEGFEARYLRSDAARLAFLSRQLSLLRRRGRVASVAACGRLPSPLLLPLLPAPVGPRFGFRRPRVDRDAAATAADGEAVGVRDEAGDAPREPPEQVARVADADARPRSSLEDEDARERLERAERLRSEDESVGMAVEDERSRAALLGSRAADADEESEDEAEGADGGAGVAKPKRSDFSRSYFFGSLPAHFRFLSAAGWGGAGCGADNGDEEAEEEERLERERERQRLLDRQEAERALEAERLAERLHVERERDERALQARRLRAAELRKVLLRQGELEAQRRLELERRRVEDDRRRAAAAEDARQEQLARREADRRAMEAEDAEGQAQRRSQRAAAAQSMRRRLEETAGLAAEDERSRALGRELRRRERDEDARRRLLELLYAPFEPFFPRSALPREDLLPSVQRRLRALRTASRSPYAVPFVEAEDVEPGPYLARDSRKFELLLGLPARRWRQHTRIPSEQAIVQRQQLQSRGPPRTAADGPRASVSAPADATAGAEGASGPLGRPRRDKERRRPRRLPELQEGGGAAGERLGHARAATASQNQLTHQRDEQRHPPSSSTPFFRGNMIVRGLPQGRTSDCSSYS